MSISKTKFNQITIKEGRNHSISYFCGKKDKVSCEYNYGGKFNGQAMEMFFIKTLDN